MVIIADKRDEDAYCSGCVIMKDGAVTVIASSDFVKRRERRMKVVFFGLVRLVVKPVDFG